MVNLHSKIAFSLVTSSKLKKKIENKTLSKSQFGGKGVGQDAAIHICQQVIIQQSKCDFISADAIKAFYSINRDIILDTLKESFPQVYNMFMVKYNNNANAFVYGLREGVLNLQQTEGGSPGSPEMSFLYELGISSFIKNIDDLISSTNLPFSEKGIVTSYIDDLYWAAPFEKMVEVIKFVQEKTYFVPETKSCPSRPELPYPRNTRGRRLLKIVIINRDDTEICHYQSIPFNKCMNIISRI